MTLSVLTAGTVTTGTDTYGYTAGTNKLASIANTGGTRSFGYDGRGNLASESRPGSISATTGYDGYARLTSYVRSDVGTLTFAYNGRDDRVAKTSGAGTRRFVYDPDGRVVGEADGAGKYDDPGALFAEKQREDWLRDAHDVEGVRWVPREMRSVSGRAEVVTRFHRAAARAA